MIGRMIPVSISDVIWLYCAPFARMNRNEKLLPRPLVFLRMLKLRRRKTCCKNQFSPCSLAKSGSGGPEIEISLPPGFSTFREF